MNPLFELAKIAEALDRSGMTSLAKSIDNIAERLAAGEEDRVALSPELLTPVIKEIDKVVEALQKAHDLVSQIGSLDDISATQVLKLRKAPSSHVTKMTTHLLGKIHELAVQEEKKLSQALWETPSTIFNLLNDHWKRGYHEPSF